MIQIVWLDEADQPRTCQGTRIRSSPPRYTQHALTRYANRKEPVARP